MINGYNEEREVEKKFNLIKERNKNKVEQEKLKQKEITKNLLDNLGKKECNTKVNLKPIGIPKPKICIQKPNKQICIQNKKIVYKKDKYVYKRKCIQIKEDLYTKCKQINKSASKGIKIAVDYYLKEHSK